MNNKVDSDFFKDALLDEKLESPRKIDKMEFINIRIYYFVINILSSTILENAIKYLYNIFIMMFIDTKFLVLEQDQKHFEIIVFSKNNLPNGWDELYKISVKEIAKIDINVEKIFYAEKLNEVEELFSSACSCGEYHNNIGISNAKKYIDEHISEKLSLKIIAENVYLSPSYLSRTFKKCYGVNLSKYIQSERINKAKQYLVTSDFPIREIMRMSGFDYDGSYFYQEFKKYTGITPAEYRKMFRG